MVLSSLCECPIPKPAGQPLLNLGEPRHPHASRRMVVDGVVSCGAFKKVSRASRRLMRPRRATGFLSRATRRWPRRRVLRLKVDGPLFELVAARVGSSGDPVGGRDAGQHIRVDCQCRQQRVSPDRRGVAVLRSDDLVPTRDDSP